MKMDGLEKREENYYIFIIIIIMIIIDLKTKFFYIFCFIL